MSPELHNAVREFMDLAGCTTAGFNARQAALYTGLQCEELAEKLEAISKAGPNESLRTIASALNLVSASFKQGVYDGSVELADRAELVDGDIDLAWVSLGALHSTAHDPYGCTREVARANLDKFPGGVVTRDANGKVVKPDGWRGPDFTGIA